MRRTACLVLTALLAVAPICAEAHTVTRYPIALVNVNADSSLNVRQSPAGKWAYISLPCWADVVILQTVDGWAWVNTPERMQDGEAPIGWVSMDYLRVYREYIKLED